MYEFEFSFSWFISFFDEVLFEFSYLIFLFFWVGFHQYFLKSFQLDMYYFFLNRESFYTFIADI